MKKVTQAQVKAAASSATPQKRQSKAVHTPPAKVAVIPATRREARAARKGKVPAATQKQGVAPLQKAPQKRSQTTGKLPKVSQASGSQASKKPQADKNALLAQVPSIGADSGKFKPVKRTQSTARRKQGTGAVSVPPIKKKASPDKPMTPSQAARAEAAQARKRMREERKQARREARTWKYFAVMGTTIAVLLVSLYLVYPVAQGYYQTVREQDKLQAEYKALTARNAQIQAEIDNLNTPEGIEDYARSELGWVRNGDNPVTVLNVGDTTGSTSLPKQVNADTVEIPNAWYNRLLDKVFFID